ncbi:hypothetical protein IP88_15315 [alpha proteobacterium AAP81b]|nr:hypothetical protein IP88_15315 [alpha proteobacterium AAP81b]
MATRAIPIDALPARPVRSSRRFLAKAISWRIVGTLDTFILSVLLLTFLGPWLGIQEHSRGHTGTAGLIALTEVATKIALFYVHEWLWARLHWGLGSTKEQHRRSLMKAVAWRVFASLDTTILALIYTGNLKMAVSIGGAEVITKIFLYYLHERAWERITLGKAAR